MLGMIPPPPCSGECCCLPISSMDDYAITSYALLNDDKPHAVELLLEGKNLTMRIDGGLSRSLINNGPKDKLSITRSTFLGGLPRDAGESAIGQWHLRNSTSLKGNS
jgi:hypothetical protein